jgi:hypothetical protein
MAATTATVMATAKTKTGKDDDDNSQGGRRQGVRTATTMGKDDNAGKDVNSKEDGNDGKDDQKGR